MTTASINLCVFVLLAFMNILCSADDNCTPKEMAQEDLQKLATANNELALNLHRELASESSDNIFISPFSISTVFGILFYGARGSTAQELRDVLGYTKAGISDDVVQATFHYFLTHMLKEGDSSDAYVLESANEILLSNSLELVPGYKSAVECLYQALVKEVDFRKDGDKIVDQVNQWVKEKTNGKIDKLLDDLSPNTVMVLLNAVYFKGTWKLQFDPEKTKPQIFYNNGLESGTNEVPFMHMSTRLRYAQMPGYQALELLYKGGNISMLILLPDERDGLAALEKSLTPEKLVKILDELKDEKVNLSLPKFKLQYYHELSQELKSLGAEKIFQAGAADFSGMTPSKKVSVSEVLHKAVIEVNEKGSEAAAVTGIVAVTLVANVVPEFLVDHPFLFFILERGSNLILFMGCVKNL